MSDETVRPIGEVVPPGTPGTASPEAVRTPERTEDYDLSRSLADTRREIAIFLLYIFAGVVAAPVVATVVFSGWCWLHVETCPAASQALDLLSRNASQYVTAIIGIVGSVVGFYFGSNSSGGSTTTTTTRTTPAPSTTTRTP